MAKFHFHLSLHLCLTWVCCCKRNAILSVECGFVLRKETKVDDEQTLAGECVQHGRLSPCSSLDRCLELHYWQLQRRGHDPNRSIATPPVSEASVGRPWSGRHGKTCVRFQTCKTRKVDGTDDPHLLQVASRRIVSILWISSSMCAFPLSFHASSRTEPVSCEFRTHFQDFTQPQS